MLRLMTFRLIKVAIIACCCILLSGCDKRNNREWVENRVSEVSRVYPTADLYDLFEEFPNGFTIEQTRATDKKYGLIELILTGDAETKTIKGSINEWVDNARVSQVEMTYQDGDFSFSDETKAKDLWPMQAFLFQSLTIDKTYLSSLKAFGSSYSLENGMFGIKYEMNNDLITNYLKSLKAPANLPLGIYGSESNRGYYFTIVLEEYPFRLSERVYVPEK